MQEILFSCELFISFTANLNGTSYVTNRVLILEIYLVCVWKKLFLPGTSQLMEHSEIQNSHLIT